MRALICFLLVLLNASASFPQNTDWEYRNIYPQNDLNDVTYFNSGTGYICGASGFLLKTTNSFSTFHYQAAGVTASLNSLYFFNELTGFVCGNNSAILFTSNGGVNWIVKTPPGSDSLRSITFINPGTGFACGANGVLLKSTNSGMNWFAVPGFQDADLNFIWFMNQVTGYIGAGGGKIFTTINGGQNWAQQNAIGPAQNVKCIKFTNSLTGFLSAEGTPPAGSKNLYKTSDGGNSWQTINLVMRWGYSFYGIEFINASTGYVCSSGPLWITTNAGISWNYGGMSPGAVKKGITRSDTSVIVCGTNGWISKVEPSGKQEVFGGSKANLFVISFFDENTGLCIGDYQVNRTNNSGLNWKINIKGFVEEENSEQEYQVAISNLFGFPSGNYYIANSTITHPVTNPIDTIFKSTDKGQTWSNFYIGNGNFKDMEERQGAAYFLFLDNLKKTLNGTAYTVVLTAPFLHDVSFANANTGIVLQGTYPGNGGMHRTTNGGVNWVFTEYEAGKYIENVELLSTGTGYAAGDSGYVIKSTNSGLNWQVLNNGPEGRNMEIRFVDDNNGWLLYYLNNPVWHRKMYHTNDGGQSFHLMTSLDQFNVYSFSFVNANTGFVCGLYGDILKTTNGGLSFVNQIGEVYPGSFSLSQNYPNPFNPVTNIGFRITESGLVKLTIYDVLGKEIAVIVNEEMHPGSFNVDWDASNYPSGVYFYKLVAGENTNNGGFVESKKMVLIK